MHSGTKDQIIEVLSSRFPLSAKRIYNELKKRYLSSVTYHACYMHIQELVGQGVLVKEGMEYRLDGRWIEKSQTFFNNTEMNYAEINNSSINLAKEKECITMLRFESLDKMHDFMTSFKKRFIDSASTRKTSEVYWLVDHLAGPIFYMKERAEYMQKIKDEGITYGIAIRGFGNMDKFVENMYRGFGLDTIRIGVSDYDSSTVAIFNDILFHILMPEDIRKALDDLFKMEISSNNMPVFLNELINRKANIYLIIIKSPELVKYYKEKISSLLKQ